MDQDNDWVKSDMMLNENCYCKDFLHLVETANEKFPKSICLILKQFFTESKHPPSLSPSSCLCPSATSFLSPSLSSPPLLSSLVSPPPSSLRPPSALPLLSSSAVSSVQSTLLFPSPQHH